MESPTLATPYVGGANMSAVLTYKALHGDALMHVQDMLQLKHYQPNTRQSTSSEGTTELLVPFNKKSRFADHGFRTFAPQVWNALPARLRNSRDLLRLKSCHKTRYFNKAFTV